MDAICDFTAQDLFLLAGLYLTTGLVMLTIVTLAPRGRKPRFSLVITWPFALAVGLAGLVVYLLRRLLKQD